MTIGTLIRRAALLGTAALAAAAFAAPAFAQKTKLTVYTALENDQLEPFKKAFEADNPTIEIAWVRDSTGVVAAKLIAEKDNPRADIIWGLAASNVGAMAAMGMLEPYTPAGAAAYLLLAEAQRNEKKYIEANATLQVFINKNPITSLQPAREWRWPPISSRWGKPMRHCRCTNGSPRVIRKVLTLRWRFIRRCIC